LLIVVAECVGLFLEHLNHLLVNRRGVIAMTVVLFLVGVVNSLSESEG
jgi:hypothetical protein